MVKINRKDKVKITNIERERYHGPLITDGVSLGYIKIYPWINLEEIENISKKSFTHTL